MPRLNLKEDPFEGDITQDSTDRNVNAPPSLRDVGGGGGVSPLLLIIIILVVLAGGVFLLNHFGIVHLWGSKTTQLADQLSESDLPPPDWASGEEGEAPGRRKIRCSRPPGSFLRRRRRLRFDLRRVRNRPPQ